jgi:uncharacterized integral membrane protein
MTGCGSPGAFDTNTLAAYSNQGGNPHEAEPKGEAVREDERFILDVAGSSNPSYIERLWAPEFSCCHSARQDQAEWSSLLVWPLERLSSEGRSSTAIASQRDEAEGTMSNWMAFLAGTIASLIASILANLWHDRITGFLESRKLASQSKSLSKAVAFHDPVRALHTGDRDKYLYMMRLQSSATMNGIIAFILIATGTIMADQHSTGKLFAFEWPYPLSIFFVLMSAGMMFVFAKASTRYRAIVAALEDFNNF